MNNHSNEGRIAHLEGTVEHMVVEIADLKLEVRDHRRETRQDCRFLIGLQLTTTLALIGVMAKGFGWL